MITLLTPTFNRAHTLEHLYKSLLDQSTKDFTWLIIDDGSLDSTKNIVQKFIWQNKINISYIFQENQGKHIALNTGMKFINTELVAVVDSDDRLAFNAIETIYRYWEMNKDKNLCGMCFLKGVNNNVPIGDKFNQSPLIDTYINTRINGEVKGDKFEVWKSYLLSEYHFPQFQNEKFIGEAMLWVQVSKNFRMLFANEIIYFCEYLNGGLTQSGRKLRLQNPMGGMAHANEFLTSDFKLKIRSKNALLYNCYSFFAKKNIVQSISLSKSKFFVLLYMPLGFLLHLFWKYKYFGMSKME